VRVSDGFFLRHSKGISYHYATLFGGSSPDGNQAADRVHEKWGWYGMMYQLADGDLLKMPQVEKIYIEEALTFMAYQKDLNMVDKVKT
jgi:hypothetical protein